jgi:hypothetical protein
LNVFFVENTSRNIVTRTEIEVKLTYAPSDVFKFDVLVGGEKDCMAKCVSFELTCGNQWCDLSVTSIQR